jgi:hypothetical protein
MITMGFKPGGLIKVNNVLLKILPEESIKNLANAAGRTAEATRQIGWMLAPQKTGQLARDIKIKSQARGLVRKVGVYSRLRGFIARFLTWGVKPHSVAKGAIVKRGKNQTGRLHPGFTAKDFLLGPSKGLRAQAMIEWNQALTEAVQRANTELQR